ncbi:MAG: phenylacetate--CoA ligase family protein [Clostridia bacterium]|nr:phenylacetate--CoA ligase family protein [Clostridia bacterium]
MLSEKLRYCAYWCLDSLKGKPVKKHLDEITKIMEDSSLVKEHQEKQFKKILTYAADNVEFYKNYDKNSKLSDLPVITKQTLKDNYEKFQSPEFTESDVVVMSTSGSTGTPFKMWQDRNKRNRVFAEMMYFWGTAGYKIGMKYVFFRVWTNKNKKSKLSAFARNLIMKDIVSLDKENLESIRCMLKKNKKIKMILGYASTLENLANYLLECNDTPDMFKIKTVISGSEVLTEDTREKLKKVFGCLVVSFYSNQENGTLAIECVDNKEFHVNDASYIIELLKPDCDEPVEPGEEGRVVVTDLYNRAMPVIRYDTGDMAVSKKEAECKWKSNVFASISGRRDDMLYATDGTPISSHTFGVYMWQYNKLKQYQFIQNGEKEYIIKLNGADMYSDDELTDFFKGVLGNDATIEIRRVDGIPVLASGKFKRTVCNYKGQAVTK